METTAVSILGNLANVAETLLPSSLVRAGPRAAQYTALPADVAQFFVRRDPGDANRRINVFNGSGQLLYVAERKDRAATLWTIYAADSRRQIAAVRVGLLNKSVSFLAKAGIQHRKITAGDGIVGFSNPKFYLNDGAGYQWTRDSQYLERVINPGGGHEELHERVARARLLRRFRFDWELLVSRAFDAEIAIATALVPMLSQWSLSKLASAPGARSAPAPAAPAIVAAAAGEVAVAPALAAVAPVAVPQRAGEPAAGAAPAYAAASPDKYVSDGQPRPFGASATASVAPLAGPFAAPASFGPAAAAAAAAAAAQPLLPAGAGASASGARSGALWEGAGIPAGERAPLGPEAAAAAAAAPHQLVYEKPASVRSLFSPPSFVRLP